MSILITSLVIGNFNNGVVIRTVNFRLLLRSKIGGGARSRNKNFLHIFKFPFIEIFVLKMGQAQRVDNYTGCLKIREFQIRSEFSFSNYFSSSTESFHPTL
jgi:hypothetical protein